jgi:hypothetical protein
MMGEEKTLRVSSHYRQKTAVIHPNEKRYNFMLAIKIGTNKGEICQKPCFLVSAVSFG